MKKKLKELKPEIKLKMEKNFWKSIPCKLQFIDSWSVKFMASSLSNLVDNLAKGINKFKYIYRDDNKKQEEFGV